MEVDHMKAGVVTCLRLHLFEEPNVESAIVSKFRYLTSVLVDLDKSTGDFYKIYTAIGAEGYAKKEDIALR